MYKGISFFIFLLFPFCLLCQTTTFNFTGTEQLYTVPPCVTALDFDVIGASGATINHPAGKGGRVQGTLAVTPGTVLRIYVGGAGTGPHSGGYNGGGDGAAVTSNPCGRGGGASDIRVGGSALTDRVVVAGGGGGGGNGVLSNGGDGGGLVGNPGLSNWGDQGTGGTQTDGGVGGCWLTTCGLPGTLGKGGDGYNAGANDGAGGGGGYYGGGGGGGAWGGGGGGSSFAGTGTSRVTHTGGYQAGNGRIVLTVSARSGNPPGAPTALTGPDSFCPGDTLKYSITGDPTATSYLWTFPAGSQVVSGDNTTSVTVVPGASGTISVQAINDCGSSAVITKTVEVLPLPVADAGPDVAICAGEEVSLTGSGGVSCSWSHGVASCVSTVSPAVTSSYQLTVVDANGCRDDDMVMVIVNAQPVADAGPDHTICEGQEISITGTGSGIFRWFPPEGLSDTVSSSPIAAPLSTTTYTLTVTNEFGCRAADQFHIIVHPKPEASISGPSEACAGKMISLVASGGNSYSWDTGSNDAQLATPAVIGYVYRCIVTDANGCSDTAGFTVQTDTIALQVSGPGRLCAGESAVLTATGADSYEWNTGATTGAISIAPFSSTTYKVAGTAGACRDTAVIDVFVQVVTAIAGNDTVLCAGKSLQINASGGSVYQWSPSAGLSCTSCPDPIATPDSTTTYLLIVADSLGCIDSDSITILVDPCLSLHEQPGPVSGLGPNPVAGKLSFQLLTPGMLQLYDISGRLCYTNDADSGLNEVDFSTLQNGLYVLQITTAMSQWRYAIVKTAE